MSYGQMREKVVKLNFFLHSCETQKRMSLSCNQILFLNALLLFFFGCFMKEYKPLFPLICVQG